MQNNLVDREPAEIERLTTMSFLQDSMLDQEEEVVLLQVIRQYMM